MKFTYPTRAGGPGVGECGSSGRLGLTLPIATCPVMDVGAACPRTVGLYMHNDSP